MANFEAFCWNFSLSTKSEIGRSDVLLFWVFGSIELLLIEWVCDQINFYFSKMPSTFYFLAVFSLFYGYNQQRLKVGDIFRNRYFPNVYSFTVHYFWSFIPAISFPPKKFVPLLFLMTTKGHEMNWRKYTYHHAFAYKY